MDNKKISNQDLAIFFLEKVQKESIIAEVFNFFGVHCLVRNSIDSKKLDELISDFKASDYQNKEILSEIIDLIRSGMSKSEVQEKELLEDIKKCILEQLCEETSLGEMSNRLHVSSYYLCHFFKQQTGMTLNAFKNQKRIENAMRELVETDKKITDIAMDQGFVNISYFTELFGRIVGKSPSEFRAKAIKAAYHNFYRFEHMLTMDAWEKMSFMDKSLEYLPGECVQKYPIYEPTDQFEFLHEAAIIEHKGVLYASWYNCPKSELQGYTPINGKRSYDGGKTWTSLEVIAEDPSGKILYCPPVYGICDERLYMLVNEMVAPDHIHAMDLYVLNEETDRFEFLWSKPIPFKLNTNVVKLPNGKLLLPGRIGELDGFPNTPAVMISDSGKIDSQWRLVKIAENGDLPYGKQLVHPELTLICSEDVLYMFCRNICMVPLVYLSRDFGETWSAAFGHDIPYIDSKMYSGTLTSGEHYLIGNTYNGELPKGNARKKLYIYFSKKGKVCFDRCLILFDEDLESERTIHRCHYPAAVESNGKLYVIATASDAEERRGAVLYVINLQKISLWYN